MTHLRNAPDDFPAEATEGFLLAHRRHVRGVYGGCVRATTTPRNKVALVLGGGSGHYPAFAGWVGPGMADGAVMGNIFSSPSAAQAVSVVKACERGGGVIIAFGNYAGDVLQFGQAAVQLQAEGIDARTLVVTDDLASAGTDEIGKRRGIAGDFPVFKLTGAAAERGMGIDEVERIFRKANDATRTLGVAFDGCTLPGAPDALFHVPEGRVGIGLGIHGEPGIDEIDMVPADEIAAILVERIMQESDAATAGLADPGQRRAVVLWNGLGATKYEEMFVGYRAVVRRLEAAGVEIVDAEVGEQVTSLDMAGVSLTLTWVDEELEALWLDPVDTPAFRRGAIEADYRTDELPQEAQLVAVTEPGSPASQALARELARGFAAVTEVLRGAQDELGTLDSYAGDGDHGIGMVRGAEHARQAADDLAQKQAGAGTLLTGAGAQWSTSAGGTSGALWGTFLSAIGAGFGDRDVPDARGVAAAVRRGLEALQGAGGARVGDKTMIDALVPFVDELDAKLADGASLTQAWAPAAEAARRAAEETAELSPKIGRARPLAERSVGHADPGATSLAVILVRVGELLD